MNAVLRQDNGTGLSCNLASVTIDQQDLCAITSLFQSTLVIMSLRQRGEWGLALYRTQIPELDFNKQPLMLTYLQADSSVKQTDLPMRRVDG